MTPIFFYIRTYFHFSGWLCSYVRDTLLYQYSNCNLPSAFDSFFTAINTRHNYSTRLASKSTFVFPKIRTIYGKFNIRYFGPKIWNEIEEQLKTLTFRCFKRELKERFLDKYITNNNWGRLKFLVTISLFFFFTWLFFPLFFYLCFSGSFFSSPFYKNLIHFPDT